MKDVMRERLLLSALIGCMILKVIYAGISPFSSDFLSWSYMGSEVVARSGDYLGVYTVPTYIYAAAYTIWLYLTNDPSTFPRLLGLFFFGGRYSGALPLEFIEFTLVMKVPMLLADSCTMVFVVFAVKAISRSSTKGLMAGVLWASSPLVLLLENSTTVEIYPALLILIGTFAIYRIKTKLGSAFMGLGTLTRFVPLLFIWIYLVAFARSRRFRILMGFVIVQLGFLLLGAFALTHLWGPNAVIRMFNERPGVVAPEIVTSFGPFVSGVYPYNPDIGVGFVCYGVLAYFITKPSIWKSRPFGAETVSFFALFFALTSFSIPFMLWLFPTLVVFAMVTGFGVRRYLLTTALGFLFYLFEAPAHLSQEGRALFFIPNWNQSFATTSATMNGLASVPLLPEIFRALFAASLILVVFWVFRSATGKPSAKSGPEMGALKGT